MNIKEFLHYDVKSLVTTLEIDLSETKVKDVELWGGRGNAPMRSLHLHINFTLFKSIFYLPAFNLFYFKETEEDEQRVPYLFFTCHLLALPLSYILKAVSHLPWAFIPTSIVFSVAPLCPCCLSQAFKAWLNISLPTFTLWSFNSYMDVCFIQDGSSIYYKHSLYWQSHIFRSFHFKNIWKNRNWRLR